MNKRLFISLFVFLQCTTIIFAQRTDITGEDEFSWKRRDRANISFGMDLGFTQTAQQYSKVFSTIIQDELFQFGFVLRGYFPITKQIKARFAFPYYYKVGIEEEDKYPNAAEIFPGVNDYLKNYGLGDLSVDVSWNILSQYSSRINLVLDVGGTLAVGESRLHSSYDGILPLGSGFHNVRFGGAISRKLSYKTVLFGGAGVVFRFPGEFEPTDYNNPSQLDGKKYDPENIFHLRAGFGYVWNFLRRGQVVNLELEYFSVGSVILSDSHLKPIMESPFTVTRIGLRFVAGRMRGLSSSFFLGYEKRNYDGTLNLAVDERKNDSWLINATFPMVIRFFNIRL